MAAISVSHLQKRYGATVAVRDVGFTVEQGEIFGILGPNGAGKTTTVECLTGLRRRDGGTVDVLGLDPAGEHARLELRELVGVQLQHSALPEKLRVAEALELYGSFYRDPADADELLDRLGLAAKRDAPYAKLSGGQQQRLAIALALIGSPRIAVLDELTTGLDPNARREVWSLISAIRERGVTVLLVTHFMEEAERLCDRVAVIDGGAVVALDTPAVLAGNVGGEQRITFAVSTPFDESLLRDLPDVTEVRRTGRQILVAGSGNVLASVASLLASQNIIAERLRVEQATLDDAFLALTGHETGADASSSTSPDARFPDARRPDGRPARRSRSQAGK
jgi:ABC-2 type transport system ATP-binding protein